MRTADRPLAPEPARDRKLLQLGLLFEPVARLDLDRGDALGHQRGEPPVGAGEQLGLARRARRLDGGEDAAAGARDLLIARALQAQLELMGAVAAIDEMGVAIDQARRDPAPAAIDRLARPRMRAPPRAAPTQTMRPSRAAIDPVLDRAIGRGMRRRTSSRAAHASRACRRSGARPAAFATSRPLDYPSLSTMLSNCICKWQALNCICN